MAGKIIISAKLKVLTGLHIGGSNAYSAIGAIDSSVIRNPRTGEPIIPGSSLKGKVRSLLARKLNNNQDSGKKLTHDDDTEEIKRLFGSSEKKKIKRSRLQFADAYINPESKEDFTKRHIPLTEIKTENTISRADASAMPRSIERVVPGLEFDVKIVYDAMNEEEIVEDLDLLIDGLRLLQYDYLGGHGTRGSGRVSFEDFNIEFLDTDIEDLDSLKEKFKKVENYELLNI